MASLSVGCSRPRRGAAGAPGSGLARLHEELKRRGVTLVLLWQEYRTEHPDGYGYSRFCDLCGAAVSRRPCARPHVAGEKLFVDFAGDTVL
jgi:transposase